MSRRHFEVEGKFHYAHKTQKATVTINQEADLVEVRIYRSREVLTFPLSTMVELAVSRALRVKADETRTKPKRRTFAKRGLLSVG